MSCPACRARKRHADEQGAATHKRRTADGLAWAIRWRDRNRPIFDALEARGAYAPERFA